MQVSATSAKLRGSERARREAECVRAVESSFVPVGTARFMSDDEAQFLDALYLGVRDAASFDQALDLLCRLFDVQSGTLLDFDAARPEVSTYVSVGLFSGETLQIYQREFAALDPAPPAFMKQLVGTAIPTYRLLSEEVKRPGVFFAEFFRPLGLEECLGGTLATMLAPMAAGEEPKNYAARAGIHEHGALPLEECLCADGCPPAVRADQARDARSRGPAEPVLGA